MRSRYRARSAYCLSRSERPTLLQPAADLRVLAERGQAAMDEHADVPFLAAGDFRDLPVTKPFAPQVDGLALCRRQFRD